MNSFIPVAVVMCLVATAVVVIPLRYVSRDQFGKGRMISDEDGVTDRREDKELGREKSGTTKERPCQSEKLVKRLVWMTALAIPFTTGIMYWGLTMLQTDPAEESVQGEKPIRLGGDVKMLHPNGMIEQESKSQIHSKRASRGVSAEAEQRTFVEGRVFLDPSLRELIGPDDVIFIFATSVGPDNSPVALLRKRVEEFPMIFSLTDEMQPAAGIQRLSDCDEVLIGVRISRSGNFLAKSGDLEGETPLPLKLNTRQNDIVINHIRP